MNTKMALSTHIPAGENLSLSKTLAAYLVFRHLCVVQCELDYQRVF